MIHQDFPSTATRAADHCSALLKRRAAPGELVPEFERVGERIAVALRRVAAAAWADSAIQVSALGAQTVALAEIDSSAAPLTVNSLHGFGKDHRLLLSLDGRALLEQLDRAFGGSGDLDRDLPAELPFSADILAKRFEAQVVEILSSELGSVPLRSLQRGGPAVALWANGTAPELAQIAFEVSGSTGKPWRIAVSVETEHLAFLLPRHAAPKKPGEAQRATVGGAPFGELPLSATATLVDMAIPLHRLAGIAPGTVLPIMVARSVPLHVGDVVVARGSVGDVDDQVALQITQTFSGKDSQ